jgi:tetraacyldisaccharide 4'-kinase
MLLVRLRESVSLRIKTIQSCSDSELRKLPIASQLLAPCLSIAASINTTKESLRQFLYRAGVFRAHSLPAPVISVGNLTSASGKTPFVMHLARHLFQFHGISSMIVQAGGGTVDETVMMENEFRDAPIRVVGHTSNPGDLKDILINSPGTRLVLLDNGLQHLPLMRDLDIVTLNSYSPLGNGHLMPRGSLREPAGPALRRCDAVVIHHVDIAGEDRLNRTLRTVEALIPRHTLKIQTLMLPTMLRYIIPPQESRTLDMSEMDSRSQYLGETLHLNLLQKSAVLVLTGVGSPLTVEAHVKKLGALHVEGCGEHEDHHYFDIDEVLEAVKRVRELMNSPEYNHVCILLTEKDFWRQRHFWHSVFMRFHDEIYDGKDPDDKKKKWGAYVLQSELQLSQHDKRFSTATAMWGAMLRLAQDHFRYRKNL